MPLMTAPFDFRQHRSVIPRWEEMVVFNEPLQRFLRHHPPLTTTTTTTLLPSDLSSAAPRDNVVVVLEILDFITRSPAGGRSYPFSQQRQQQRQQKAFTSGSRWQRVAWAFLKLVGPNGESNADRQSRLQLWHPPRGLEHPRQIPADKTEVHFFLSLSLSLSFSRSLSLSVFPLTLT